MGLACFPPRLKTKKDKGISLKARKEETLILEDESDIESGDMAILAKKFKKFLQFQKQSKDSKRFEKKLAQPGRSLH